MTREPDQEALDRLAMELDGRLTRPDDPDWEAARMAWQLSVDQRPAAVVTAESVRDVIATVGAAAAAGLQVAPQATGHNAAPLGDLRGSILLKTSQLRGVSVDPVRRIARAEAGAWWSDVTVAAAKHGLAGLAGSAADVGVVGYCLGGGLSWLGRSHGLAANSVVAFDVVTGDGLARRVDAAHEPELFWALRGGGGGAAIVTAIEMQLFEIAEVYPGVLFFPIERAAEVLQAWRAWLPNVPESVTSVGRLLRFPPLPDLPPHLSGRSYVVVEAACQLTPAEADALLAPLRALGPELDTFRPTPMTELSLLHMDPPGPVPGHGDGMLLGALSADAIDAFAAVSERTGPALLSLELRQLGGALRPERAESGGALSGLDAEFVMFAVGIAPTPEAMRMTAEAVNAALHAMAPWATGGNYANFAESARAPRSLWGASTPRLEEVKQAYDPGNVIRANHRVR